jgi:hypothetical protein
LRRQFVGDVHKKSIRLKRAERKKQKAFCKILEKDLKIVWI